MPPSLLFDLEKINLNAPPLFDKEAINKVNLQRYEMQQLDGVLWYDKEKFLILGYKDVTENEFWVQRSHSWQTFNAGSYNDRICRAIIELFR